MVLCFLFGPFIFTLVNFEEKKKKIEKSKTAQNVAMLKKFWT